MEMLCLGPGGTLIIHSLVTREHGESRGVRMPMYFENKLFELITLFGDGIMLSLQVASFLIFLKFRSLFYIGTQDNALRHDRVATSQPSCGLLLLPDTFAQQSPNCDSQREKITHISA